MARHVAIELGGEAVQRCVCIVHGFDDRQQHGIIGSHAQLAAAITHEATVSARIVDSAQETPQYTLLDALFEGTCGRVLEIVRLVANHRICKRHLVRGIAEAVVEQQGMVDDDQVGSFGIFARSLVKIDGDGGS